MPKKRSVRDNLYIAEPRLIKALGTAKKSENRLVVSEIELAIHHLTNAILLCKPSCV